MLDCLISLMAWNENMYLSSNKFEFPLVNTSIALEAACGDVEFLVSTNKFLISFCVWLRCYLPTQWIFWSEMIFPTGGTDGDIFCQRIFKYQSSTKRSWWRYHKISFFLDLINYSRTQKLSARNCMWKLCTCAHIYFKNWILYSQSDSEKVCQLNLFVLPPYPDDMILRHDRPRSRLFERHPLCCYSPWPSVMSFVLFQTTK